MGTTRNPFHEALPVTHKSQWHMRDFRGDRNFCGPDASPPEKKKKGCQGVLAKDAGQAGLWAYAI